MAAYTSFANVPVTHLSLWIPLVGLWVADVRCATADPLPASAVLVHGNLSLQGGTYRSGTFAGKTTARLVGGFGGWNRSVQQRGYSQMSGVMLSMVMRDLASDCSEKVNVQSDLVLGPFWTRPKGPAGAALRATAGASWWVDGSGTVQIGPRPSGGISTPWQATDWDPAAGIVTVATEDPASWLPGRTFQNEFVQPTQTIRGIRHTLDGAGVSRMRVVV